MERNDGILQIAKAFQRLTRGRRDVANSMGCLQDNQLTRHLRHWSQLWQSYPQKRIRYIPKPSCRSPSERKTVSCLKLGEQSDHQVSTEFDVGGWEILCSPWWPAWELSRFVVKFMTVQWSSVLDTVYGITIYIAIYYHVEIQFNTPKIRRSMLQDVPRCQHHNDAIRGDILIVRVSFYSAISESSHV